ncbi:hypothetical protein C1H46_008808 [Malus baccata]|uniref:Uncharacterized protein n=1 Tax=Malus baccata TaxID=106549 RepID=A0A540N3E2_MALBA|nr:hypothetical protein C1H46_008808 [Malus baccata]
MEREWSRRNLPSRGPQISAAGCRSRCWPITWCISAPRASRPPPSCATTCSCTTPSPSSARPRA